MDDQTDKSRHPEAPHSSLRDRLQANRLLRGVGNAAVAVNGMLGQGTTPPPILPPAEERSAPPVPEDDAFAAAFRKVQEDRER